jgi:hypothetical protein
VRVRHLPLEVHWGLGQSLIDFRAKGLASPRCTATAARFDGVIDGERHAAALLGVGDTRALFP